MKHGSGIRPNIILCALTFAPPSPLIYTYYTLFRLQPNTFLHSEFLRYIEDIKGKSKNRMHFVDKVEVIIVVSHTAHHLLYIPNTLVIIVVAIILRILTVQIISNPSVVHHSESWILHVGGGGGGYQQQCSQTKQHFTRLRGLSGS